MARKRKATTTQVSSKAKKRTASDNTDNKSAVTTVFQDSPLLNLPAELRNRIYELTLVKGEPVKILQILLPQQSSVRRSHTARTMMQMKAENKDLAREPALLHTCQQVRNEATAIYYGGNTFYVRDKATLLNWSHAIGETKWAMLRRVQGFFEACNKGATMSYASLLISLKDLEYEAALKERPFKRYSFHLHIEEFGEVVFFNGKDFLERFNPLDSKLYRYVKDEAVSRGWLLAED